MLHENSPSNFFMFDETVLGMVIPGMLRGTFHRMFHDLEYEYVSIVPIESSIKCSVECSMERSVECTMERSGKRSMECSDECSTECSVKRTIERSVEYSIECSVGPLPPKVSSTVSMESSIDFPSNVR